MTEYHWSDPSAIFSLRFPILNPSQCWPVSKRTAPDGESDLSWPKVQKYCLISPASAYTDFHVDFGGTSVWYHVHKGEKIFWFIPPTKKNFELFQKWTMSLGGHFK